MILQQLPVTRLGLSYVQQIRSHTQNSWSHAILFLIRKLDVLCCDDYQDITAVLHTSSLIKLHYRELFNYKRIKRN